MTATAARERRRCAARGPAVLALVLSVLAAVPTPAAAADVYTCKDARGKVVFSDRPCAVRKPATAAAPAVARLDVADERQQGPLLERLLLIARHANLADTALVEQTLAIRLVRRDGEQGSLYGVAPETPLPWIELSYVVDRPPAGGPPPRHALALRVDRDHACIRPETVAIVFGDDYRVHDFGPNARPDVAAKLRRNVYAVAATAAATLSLTVTYERRREFCVDLLNLEQAGR